MLKTEESLLNAQLYVLRYNALKSGLVQRQQKISTLEIELEKVIAEQRQTKPRSKIGASSFLSKQIK